MKRYLLFAGMTYMEIQGADSVIRSLDTVEEAEAFLPTVTEHASHYDWAHLLDLQDEYGVVQVVIEWERVAVSAMENGSWTRVEQEHRWKSQFDHECGL